jgi:hypothetical protein
MTPEFACSPEPVRTAGLTPVRRHAALVRALLDELERVAPAPDISERRSDGDGGGQLIEELARLGCRIFECAAAMTRTV